MFGARLPIAAAIAAAAAWSVAPEAATRQMIVQIDGVALSSGQVLAVVVDGELDRPDTATVIVTPGTPPADFKGRGVDIAAVDGVPILVFNGVVVDVQLTTDRRGRSVTVIRAANLLARLDGAKRTRDFVNQSDADIARQLATEAGLDFQAENGEELSTQRSRVSQHNQTDLEFLLERASLIGYELRADGKLLQFLRRREGPAVAVGCTSGAAPIGSLLAWLSPADSVARVGVRGWDPVKKLEIDGEARQGVIPLSAAAARISLPASTIDLGFVEALQTADAVHGAATGALAALVAHQLSAEVEAEGDPSLRAGVRVALHGVGTRFGGDYYVTTVSHQFGRDSPAGWRTLLRLVRADRSVFLLPEIGDEVLVAFEHGDPSRPFVVGSLWDTAEPPPDSSPCRRDRD